MIKNILHLSDIHIRLLKRHAEYRLAFTNLYDYIDSNINNSDTICVISGDIVHSKSEMSPELIDLTAELLNELCNRLPVIILPGNHDANLNNKNRLDALSPIISLLQQNHDNLYYYKESKIYQYENIDFIVRSLLDEKDTKNDLLNCREDSVKVILYHGTVDGSKTDLGYTLNNSRVNVTSFDGADIAILGDIHLRQKLQDYHVDNGIKKPTIAYVGSFLQQDHGEGYGEHGVLLWDLDTKNYKEINIQNDYGYYTIHIKDNRILDDISDIPNSPRLRAIILDDTPKMIAKELIHDLKSQCSIQSVIINEAKKKSNTISLKEDSDDIKSTKIEDIIGNVKNVDYQNDLYKTYLKQNFPNITDSVLTEVYKINEKLNKLVKVLQDTNNTRLKLLDFEFSNMFSYGENNKINFDTLSDIVGLFGQNKTGKSSVISALLYCLYDKCDRATKAFDVMNYSKDNFVCKLLFLLNDIKYAIERIATKDKKGKVSVIVNFGYFDTDNEYISLNGDKRDSTNEVIRSYIGTYDNLVLTSVAVQGNNGGLINMTQAKRKDLFSDFIDVRIFDELLELGSKESKIIVSELNIHKNKNYVEDLSKNEVELNTYKANLVELEEEYTQLEKQSTELNNSLIKETGKLIKIDNETDDIAILERNKQLYIDNISNHEIKLNITKEAVETELTKITNLKNKVKKWNHAELLSKKSESDTLQSELNIKSGELNAIITTAKSQKQKIEQLQELEYDTNCTYCMNNVFVKDAIDTKDNFNTTKLAAQRIKSEYDALELKLLEYKTYLDELSEYEIKSSELTKEETYVLPNLISNQKTVNVELQSYRDKLIDVKNKIVKYHENEGNILKNKDTQLLINQIKKDYDFKVFEIKSKNKQIQDVSTNIKLSEKEIQRIKDVIQRIKDLEIQNTAYSYYIQCVHRQGIPYQLLSMVLPVFEQEINDILHQMVEFEIRTEVDGSDVNFYIDYGDDKKWLLEGTSGFERFVSSIAIRVALLQLSNLPKLTGFIIDEGFGVMDTDNISNVPLLFEYLKQYFDFILIVSHIDMMKDSVKDIIEITQIDGFSKVNN